MNLYIIRHRDGIGHICAGANVEVVNAEGKTVGFLVPEAADWLVRQGVVMDITVKGERS